MYVEMCVCIYIYLCVCAHLSLALPHSVLWLSEYALEFESLCIMGVLGFLLHPLACFQDDCMYTRIRSYLQDASVGSYQPNHHLLTYIPTYIPTYL